MIYAISKYQQHIVNYSEYAKEKYLEGNLFNLLQRRLLETLVEIPRRIIQIKMKLMAPVIRGYM